ncbi:MAG TPA: M28 family peptidase [Vicinamibacterales bacterium]|nr:M28 family peptidase [Vicinamibacterales bacterium]
MRPSFSTERLVCSPGIRRRLTLARACQAGVIAAVAVAVIAPLGAQRAPTLPAETLLDRAVLDALDQELSGVAAKDHVSHLAQMHRVPASPGFHEAIEYVMGRAKTFGLHDVHIETFPGDGETWFGTLHGNRGWRVDGGTLDEVQPQPRRIISFDDVRLAVADNSESGDVTAELVDAGSGARAADYEGKDVRGKLVLCDATPGVCHRLAVEERGAKGLVSYNSNQPSAWWRDDQDLIRWGHLDARGRRNTFAIMISLRDARALQQRLARGEHITLHAVVKAHNDDASPYETLVATIPGSDPAAGDIVFSCHLDHQKPGANDNASGCSANLEIARTLQTLIDAKRIPPPARTIRFIWPSEMTGTIAYLTKYPEIAGRIRAAVHLDMVGGDPFITKSVLHVTRSPWSIATVTDDVEEVFGRYVIDGAFRAAGDGDMTHAIRSQSGSKDAFWADITPYESGSDHWIYQEGGFAIPSIYLRDHPDIYIHTNKDLPDNIEPTKIKRSAFIAAASGYYLATMPDRGASLIALSYANAQQRLAEDGRRAVALAADATQTREATNIVAQGVLREQRRLASVSRFVAGGAPPRVATLSASLAETGKGLLLTFLPGAEAQRVQSAGFHLPSSDPRVPVRNGSIKGPLAPEGDWVIANAGPDAGKVAIARVPGSDDVTYELVNFIDGVRTVGEIRDAVSAELGPVELKAVAEYFDVLAKAGAVTFRR